MVLTEPIWKSKDSLWESFLFFFHVGSKNVAQVIWLGSKHLYPCYPLNCLLVNVGIQHLSLLARFQPVSGMRFLSFCVAIIFLSYPTLFMYSV